MCVCLCVCLSFCIFFCFVLLFAVLGRVKRIERATMELQIKTAAQMRDQGHALKQKALDLVSEAERKVRPSGG